MAKNPYQETETNMYKYSERRVNGCFLGLFGLALTFIGAYGHLPFNRGAETLANYLITVGLITIVVGAAAFRSAEKPAYVDKTHRP